MEANQATSFQFLDTTATKKIFQLKKRIRAVAGGTAASKTISILVWCIDYCQSRQEHPKLVTITSESFPHLNKGAILDFKNIMKDRGYWKDDRWNETQHFYTFETGHTLQFTPFDTFGKAHGPRRDVLFINEANNIPYNIVDQLIVRTREIVWMDWNPSAEFWFYTDMLGKRDDIDFITLTYVDNEALDEITKAEIESHKGNRGWWQVYGLGQLGEAEDRIYKGWEILDEIPHDARLERYGLDFGYTNDPTACDAIYKWNNSFIIDEIIHQKGLSNRQIADVLLNVPKALVIADGAEPKSIDELSKEYGVMTIAATKGVDSVNQGIQFLQDQRIYVTRRSTNTLKEYRNYLWIRDRDGKVINEPSPIWNHHMDAVRYAIMSFANKPRWKPNPVGGVLPYFEDFPI